MTGLERALVVWTLYSAKFPCKTTCPDFHASPLICHEKKDERVTTQPSLFLPQGVMVLELVPLRVTTNLSHTHKTRFWYLLGVPFKVSNNHPRHFYMGVPSPAAGFLHFLPHTTLCLFYHRDPRLEMSRTARNIFTLVNSTPVV